MGNNSLQMLEQLKSQVSAVVREIDLKKKNYDSALVGINKKKAELQKMENDANGIKRHLEELESKRVSMEQQIARVQEELRKIVGGKK